LRLVNLEAAQKKATSEPTHRGRSGGRELLSPASLWWMCSRVVAYRNREICLPPRMAHCGRR
jgi:hypothetical protein